MVPNPLDFLEPGAVALLVAILLAGIAAFALGKVVPRSLYDKQEARADKATEGLIEVSGALKNLTDEIRYSRRKES